MNGKRAAGRKAGTEDKVPRAKAGCVDAGAKRAFLREVKAGARLEDAARAAGRSLSAFYKARRADADFADDWADALELSALRERTVPLPEADGETVRIAPNSKRPLQVRKMRHVKFVGRRVEIFLSHFAGTGDVTAAAEAAGVDESTVYNHYRKDPAFAAEWDGALLLSYAKLEAEALRQRLKAMERIRDALIPEGETAAEFDRVMRLLERAERRLKRGDGRAFSKVNPKRVTFDQAIDLLEKKLRALSFVIPPLPPDVAARYDGARPVEAGQDEQAVTEAEAGTVTSNCPHGR
ncbi:MAG TPA: hypothetical protein VD887_10630 [Allosphingosinicella sp.]|nr:hypothetical protein [Allosphingosinicella sp.]